MKRNNGYGTKGYKKKGESSSSSLTKIKLMKLCLGSGEGVFN
jgi:hypothetical protein